MNGIVEALANVNVIFYLAAYLVGGVPFGFLFAKYIAGVNIRDAGSKSIGATNVLRVVKEKDPVLGKKLGAMTLAADALKAIIPLAVAAFIFKLDVSALWGMGVLSVLGHCFSPYLGFEGGKGVATAFGALVFLAPLNALLAFVCWFAAAKTLKVSSLSSLVGLTGLVCSFYLPIPVVFDAGSMSPVVIIAILVVYKHIPNILRLFSGQEAKVVA
ncbi:MAG TPA: glycerol-3-phosphate 1-O-acyltransferase PlsY [Campylobacterales bacterium]|nr:glycerol-3-phosphate 1-O-acyltransferase PlsY [Campylobacterales bacterium]